MSFTRLFRRSTTATDGFSEALTLFHSAADRVPAYKDFLQKHGVNTKLIQTKADFARLPRMDKQTYMSKYSIKERSWDGSLENARYISSSSGSTGVPFFWPRGLIQDSQTGEVFEKIFDQFGTGPLLFVNTFALGTWIAGFEFYNAAKWVGDRRGDVTIVTPGIDKTEAVNQIRDLSPLFGRVVLAGYPPFVKDIIEAGEQIGIVWASYDVRLIVAGEAVSIRWKNKILERIGRKSQYAHFVNVYGMAEAGLVAHDTPLAQLLREHIDQMPHTVETSDGLPITGLYQFHPDARYFEAQPGEALALTANAGLPLIRYDTRDTGGILERSITALAGSAFEQDVVRLHIDAASWQLPFVYLNGRKDLSISFYALMIYVENIKYALEASSAAYLLSGLFTMSVEHTDNLDQEFTISVELAGETAPAGLADTLRDEIIQSLTKVNSEYAKLRSSLGTRADPKIVVLSRGRIQSIPGRKHRWVSREVGSGARSERDGAR